MKKTKKPSVRLVPHVRPERYTLILKPDLEAFIFEGKEVIDIIINKPVTEITLHSKDIKIQTAEIVQKKNADFAYKISYDEKAETVTFFFKNFIAKGKAKLSIIFSGMINEHLRGFYRSRYTIDGVEKHLATTQFESTDARRAFPCFDEPAHKAIFDVSLIVPGTHTAISNTLPTKISEHEGGYKVVEFASTPRMSTYLLAFIIGEFEYIEGWTKGGGKVSAEISRSGRAISASKKNSSEEIRGPEISAGAGMTPQSVQIRVFTTPGKKHQAKFALDVAIRSLEFYNEYFDIPYPFPVLDLIAIPDFESAAMENWGAVTFRETALLVDENNTSLSTKQWVAVVIAHEIAHQWFGNLVTMRWWTDLWLNEGFASYMENLCVDHMFPDWHIWDLYLADRYTVALRLDSLANSHPIEVTVHHPDEISEIFDMVSYAKGSAVIRMIAQYLGYEKFRDGLRHYLKKHSYGNTDTKDLWHSFEKVSRKPVTKMMESWTGRTGYPLISISQTKNQWSARQERFFSSRISAKNNKEKTLWHIPFAYESNKESEIMLATKKSFPLIGSSIGKINKDEGSFLRVRYDKATLARLRSEIENNTLPVADRLGIIRDLFALAEGGYIGTAEALEFSLAYKNEEQYIVWFEITSGISKVYNLIRDEVFKESFRSYARSLFTPIAEKMTFEEHKGEDHSQKFLRSLSLSHAAAYGNKTIIRQAHELFKERNKNPIRADIRSAVYGIVAAEGSTKEWETFQKLYIKETHHEEQERFGRALASFRDKTLLARTLMFTLSKHVRMQDAPFLLSAVWQNSNGRDLAWKFIQHNWKETTKRFGEGGFISRILSALGTHIKIKDARDAKKFFAKNPAPEADRTLEQAYERIHSNAAWIKADRQTVKKWLAKNYK
ncbi:MAG: M1 family metallopeptidase [Patescibacteria group bacterium]